MVKDSASKKYFKSIILNVKFHLSDLIRLTVIWMIGLIIKPSYAGVLPANPLNYIQQIGLLQAGDTLMLESGTYTNNLKLNKLNGKPGQPITILGNGITTIFTANACCNTVSLTQCSYLVLSRFLLDGQNKFVDAVKAEGTNGNWTHHITIEYITIIGYGVDQQAVGISTKCPSWNWIIRKNKIMGAGTGIYLGNSDGTMPFVNGLIEYNFISGTVGYNMQIKHQLNGTRDVFPETMIDAHTTIRYNVFSKDSNSSNGSNARPNLLTGGFPTLGWGSKDYYEIYGNFFYNNPVEALYQGTGNVIIYANIFVNHYDPGGFRAVYFTPQNGVNPQNIQFFHNTIWSNNSAGGVRLNNPAAAFTQYCYGNAVFSVNPISNFVNEFDNTKESYNRASLYFLNATTSLDQLDLYPRINQLNGSVITDTLARLFSFYNKDFNRNSFDWRFRGAYSGCCVNPGWKIQLDTIAEPLDLINSLDDFHDTQYKVQIWPNPFNHQLFISSPTTCPYQLIDLNGTIVSSGNLKEGTNEVIIVHSNEGTLLLKILNKEHVITQKLIQWK